MQSPRSFLFLAATVVVGASLALPVRAAESYDNCTGFIDSLPATISTQGTWCLRKDLNTAITSGAAITIATNNVTLNCNDFKIGGLAAGDSSAAMGVRANNRNNATIRKCSVRGFEFGVSLTGGAGHLVEDNRLDNNLMVGIHLTGDNHRVLRNAVYDTGGSPGAVSSWGIHAAADVIDNTVAGVYATATDASPRGIRISGIGNEARGNRVRGLTVAGAGSAIGIDVVSGGITVDANRIKAATATAGRGIFGWGTTDTTCSNNHIAKFATPIELCQNAGGNASQ